MILKNSMYNLAGMLLPIIIALGTIPFYIQIIGVERYGALAIALLLLSYFGQADFGIGRALTQRLAATHGSSPASQASTVYSGFAIIGLFGVVTGALSALAAYWYFSGTFDVEQGLRSEMMQSIWVIALFSPTIAISGVATGSLAGKEDFRFLSVVNLIGNASVQLLPLLTAIYFTHHLKYLLIASLIGRLLGVILALARTRKILLVGQPITVNKAEFKHLFGFGKWIMMTAVVGPIMVIADRFLIGAQLGPIAVAAYTIPFQVAQRTLVFPAAVIQVMFPRFAALDPETAIKTCSDASTLIANLFAPFIIGLICLAEPLLRIWIGDALDPRSVLIARILLAGIWVNALANVPYAYIQARGNSRFTALLHLCELPLYMVLLFGLGLAYGLPGVAAAFALRCLIDSIALFAGSRVGQIKIWKRSAFVVSLIGVALLLHPYLYGWAISLGAAALLGGASLVRAYFVTPQDFWEKLFARLRKRRQPSSE